MWTDIPRRPPRINLAHCSSIRHSCTVFGCPTPPRAGEPQTSAKDMGSSLPSRPARPAPLVTPRCITDSCSCVAAVGGFPASPRMLKAQISVRGLQQRRLVLHSGAPEADPHEIEFTPLRPGSGKRELRGSQPEPAPSSSIPAGYGSSWPPTTARTPGSPPRARTARDPARPPPSPTPALRTSAPPAADQAREHA